MLKQKVLTQLKELLEQRREGLIVYMGNYDTNQGDVAKLSLLVFVCKTLLVAVIYQILMTKYQTRKDSAEAARIPEARHYYC